MREGSPCSFRWVLSQPMKAACSSAATSSAVDPGSPTILPGSPIIVMVMLPLPHGEDRPIRGLPRRVGVHSAGKGDGGKRFSRHVMPTDEFPLTRGKGIEQGSDAPQWAFFIS